MPALRRQQATRSQTSSVSSQGNTANSSRKRKAEEPSDAPSPKKARGKAVSASAPTTAATRSKRASKPTSAPSPKSTAKQTQKKSPSTAKNDPKKVIDKTNKGKLSYFTDMPHPRHELPLAPANLFLASTSKTPSAPPASKRKATAKQATTKQTTTKTKTETPHSSTKAPATTKPVKQAKPLPEINVAPSHRVEVLVCGEGENAELGLGPEKKATGVKRPRLNTLLDVNTVGVVQVACGGMHAVALTHDHRIYTWGVNDQGALGRDTTWEGGLRDIDTGSNSDDEDDDESGLNPFESTPAAIDHSAFPEGTRFAQVAAGDSCSFALTTTGLVYGWGTFRANEGILGFSPDVVVQRTPVLVHELKSITAIACGANHVIALNQKGDAYAFGAAQQMQLGRKPVERTRATGLVPRLMGFAKGKITKVACGSYNGFAIDKNDNVWTWGLNSFGECGIEQNAGRDEAVIARPTKIPELCGQGVADIQGGEHHSIAVTSSRDCLVWGRCDGYQLGIDIKSLADDELIKDVSGRARIVIHPQPVPKLKGKTKTVAAGSDHCMAVTTDGQAWSWGFSATYQTGLGTDDDVAIAERIENTATRERTIVAASCGGQYSVLMAGS